MNLNDTGNRVIMGIVIAFLIIGAWYLGTTLKPTFGTTNTATSTSALGAVASNTVTGVVPAASSGEVKVSGEAVTVKDQPAGSSVAVASATLPQLGWVAVRDADGRTLGAALFAAGTQTDVQVPLLRDTTSGERYQVLLYVDDGDKTFDLHKDTLVTNADGSVAGTTFSAK